MSVSIGKALLERNAVNSRIQDIITRITNNATTTMNSSGDKAPTSENPLELFAELGILEKRHEQITGSIINANYNTIIRFEDNDCKIIDIIERIEAYNKRVKRIKDLITSIEAVTIKKGKSNSYNYGDNANSKETFISVMDVSNLRKMAEKVSSDKNKLQVALQEANWATQINI